MIFAAFSSLCLIIHSVIISGVSDPGDASCVYSSSSLLTTNGIAVLTVSIQLTLAMASNSSSHLLCLYIWIQTYCFWLILLKHIHGQILPCLPIVRQIMKIYQKHTPVLWCTLSIKGWRDEVYQAVILMVIGNRLFWGHLIGPLLRGNVSFYLIMIWTTLCCPPPPPCMHVKAIFPNATIFEWVI